MTAQKGKDLLLKLDSDGAGSFVTVAGVSKHRKRVDLGGDRWVFRRELFGVTKLNVLGRNNAGPFGAAAEEPLARAPDPRGVEGVAGNE
jgi:hypothetical protein